MTWTVLSGNYAEHHVVPVDDLKFHVNSILCHCVPVHDTQDARVIIHNAFDQRELKEPGHCND